MKPPPSRYRVVEQGRRLVVIDNHTGGPANPELVRGVDPGSRVQRSPAGVDDGSVFNTLPWYDDKAPRTVRLNYASRQQIKNARFVVAIVVAVLVAFVYLLWPFSLILLGVLLVQPKLYKQVRVFVTGWIDGMDQAA